MASMLCINVCKTAKIKQILAQTKFNDMLNTILSCWTTRLLKLTNIPEKNVSHVYSKIQEEIFISKVIITPFLEWTGRISNTISDWLM